jgi:hypothetical protein
MRHGGRQKGTPNKSTQSLFEICEKHGLNVFESMAKMATEDKLDPDVKFARLEALAQYLYPKRKAVEIPAEGLTFVIKDYTTGSD